MTRAGFRQKRGELKSSLRGRAFEDIKKHPAVSGGGNRIRKEKKAEGPDGGRV